LINFIFLVVTIFLGNFLRTFSSNEIIRSILIGWCGWLVLVIIILEIIKFRESKCMCTILTISLNIKLKLIFVF
jgi:uncharacterized protein YqhQ